MVSLPLINSVVRGCRIKIYILSCPEDGASRLQLEQLLVPLCRNEATEILPQAIQLLESRTHSMSMEQADLIIVILSRAYLASADSEQEINFVMARREEGRSWVVPVLLDAADLQSSRLAKLVPLPRARPLKSFVRREKAWHRIINGLRQVVCELSISSAKAQRDGVGRVLLLAASQDRLMRDEFLHHLASAGESPDVWHEGLLLAGQEKKAILRQEVERANVVVLLLSAHYFAADLYTRITAEVIDRRLKGQVSLKLVQLYPVSLPPILRDFQTHGGGVILSDRSDRDAVWVDVASDIRSRIERIARSEETKASYLREDGG